MNIRMSPVRKILVVDDSTVIREQITDALALDGYIISTAVNGQEAIEAVSAARPDLILMDLMMPVMDGLQTLRKLKSDADTSRIPVIMVTDVDNGRAVTELIDSGAIDYIPKPFSLTEIRSHVQSVAIRMKAEQDILRSAAKQRAIMASSFDPLVTINGQGIVQAASDSVERVFGWKPDELAGKNVTVLMSEPYRSEHDGYLAKHAQTGATSMLGSKREVDAVRKDGSMFPCLVTANAVNVAEGDESLYMGIFHDLSERKQLDSKLQEHSISLEQKNLDLMFLQSDRERTINDLERSNQELDDFCYIASHDLKEPLRGIHNYSVFVMEDYADKLDEEGRSKLETIVRLTQRMETLINTLLKYSRVGRSDLAMAETDLSMVLDEVVDSLHITLEKQGIDLRVPERMPVIECDQARIAEVFRNLITNAIKYNDKPEKWIEVGTIESDQAGDCDESLMAGEKPLDKTTFFVRDNGIGIQEKHMKSIFRIFKRLHSKEKFGGGTGAGLTIVKKIVERHGGRIWVESTFGEGTTFYFTLKGGVESHDYRYRESNSLDPVG